MLKKILYGFAFLILLAAVLELSAGIYVRAAKLDKKLNYIKERIGHYDQFTAGCYDRYLGYALKPSTNNPVFTSDFEVVYSINSDGLRDREINLAKPRGEFRIIALGESNVFGQGVSYGRRFTEVIEGALSKVRVINMGIPAFGMDQSFLQLERDGFKFNPDLVILFVFAPYVQRCKYYEYSFGIKPRFVLNQKQNGLILEDMDYLENKLNYKIPNTRKVIAGDRNKNSPFDKINLFIIFNYYGKIKDINDRMREQDRAYYKQAFDKVAVFKLGVKEKAKGEFSKLVFLLLEKYKKLCDGHNAALLVVNIDQSPIDYISEPCRALQIPCLDLSGALLKASKRRQLRFEVDPHYNEFTHKVIGELVGDYIQKRYSLENNKDYRYEYLGKF
ncbi:MAG: hypothetical protein PHW54_00965 [Candidatus Omnitrophica bacterium]|nr:hypothetical protein [Candidatus Omnitrophota bacterium]